MICVGYGGANDGWLLVFYGYLIILSINGAISKVRFGVLVGAFSVFGRADTGNPVQIWCVFCGFEVFPKF